MLKKLSQITLSKIIFQAIHGILELNSFKSFECDPSYILKFLSTSSWYSSHIEIFQTNISPWISKMLFFIDNFKIMNKKFISKFLMKFWILWNALISIFVIKLLNLTSFWSEYWNIVILKRRLFWLNSPIAHNTENTHERLF